MAKTSRGFNCGRDLIPPTRHLTPRYPYINVSVLGRCLGFWMRIDAHQHFWNYSKNPSDYVWMTDEHSILRRDLGPDELRPLIEKTGFDGTIAIQAREMRKETDYLLDIAREHDFVRGVVGWLDLCDPAVAEDLEMLADEKLLRGLRMLIHERADVGFAASEPHVRGVGLLAKYSLTYDLLVRPQHLRAATELVDKFPNQAFVIDHIAKPRLRLGWDEEWSAGIALIAERPNVYCKLSGMVTEADPTKLASTPFMRYLDTVLERFGSLRLMIGSDWPVCTCATDYSTTMGITMSWASRLSEAEQFAIFGDNCSRFYRLTKQPA